jgi:serine/threonine-protein kinase TTK/MPS1
MRTAGNAAAHDDDTVVSFGGKPRRAAVQKPSEPDSPGVVFFHGKAPATVAADISDEPTIAAPFVSQSQPQRAPAAQAAVAPRRAVAFQGMQQSPNTFGGVSPQGGKPKETVEVNGVAYVKLDCIGRGGSSKVFRVIAPDHKIYALKRVNLKRCDADSVQQYSNEITLLESLRGKSNIIQLIDYEINRAAKAILVVMEMGEIDLAHMLLKQSNSNKSKVNEHCLCMYWQQMLEAVHTIHEERIVHGDLKPANFLFVQGTLKLIDFGIAKAISNDTTNIVRDVQVGTLNYMAPESITDSSSTSDSLHKPIMKLGRASDVWSLGCILYQMVHGAAPFAKITNMYQKLQAIADPNHAISFPPVRNPHLQEILLMCLQRDASNRPSIPELLAHPFLTLAADPTGPADAGRPVRADAASNQQMFTLEQVRHCAAPSGSPSSAGLGRRTVCA